MENSPAKTQLAALLAKYPDMQANAVTVLEKMRARFPNSVELIYDYKHQLVCNFGPTDKGYEGVFSIVVDPQSIKLYFGQGAGMRDPHGLLQGEAKLVRWIPLDAPEDLDRTEVVETMGIAVGYAKVPFNPEQPYKLIIKSDSAKKRSRLPK